MYVLLLAATGYARTELKTQNPDIHVYTAQESDIPMLGDILTSEDETFLLNLYNNTFGEDPGLGTHSVLFGSVHKTPDNIPDIFTGQRRMKGRGRRMFPPLILPVKPPYDSKE